MNNDIFLCALHESEVTSLSKFNGYSYSDTHILSIGFVDNKRLYVSLPIKVYKNQAEFPEFLVFLQQA